MGSGGVVSLNRKCIPKIYNSVEIKMTYCGGSTIVVLKFSGRTGACS